MSLEAIKIDLESKGWIVKSGSLYGGDFVLYNPSPSHTHSEYILKFFQSPPTYREILCSLRCSRSVKKVKIYTETTNRDIRFNILSHLQ